MAETIPKEIVDEVAGNPEVVVATDNLNTFLSVIVIMITVNHKIVTMVEIITKNLEITK